MIGGIKMYKKNQNWVTFNPNSAEYLFFAPFETIYYTVQGLLRIVEQRHCWMKTFFHDRLS